MVYEDIPLIVRARTYGGIDNLNDEYKAKLREVRNILNKYDSAEKIVDAIMELFEIFLETCK